MTDYNDGKWHAWDGDACPVHKSSVVEAVWRAPHLESGATIGTKIAREIMWEFDRPSSVIAFRVIKQHRDPREVFLEADAYGNWVVSDPLSVRAIKFREVIE